MKYLREIRSWLGSFGIAFLIALVVGIFVFQPYRVDGHSMDPTLHDGERVYVSKLSHTFDYMPAYGDIVIIDSRVERKRTFMDEIKDHPFFAWFESGNDHTYYVKRVIGKPGDFIEIKGGKLYRNGKALDEPYTKEPMTDVGDQPWTVPKESIFVMGDNRNNSEDSRAIGYIPLDHVMGIMKF